MARIMSSGIFSTMLQEFSTYRHMVVCTSEPSNASSAWKLKGGGGSAMVRFTTASNMTTGPGSTTVGWTVATSSVSSAAVAAGTSNNVDHVCWLGGTSTGAGMFCTVCTTRGLTTADSVNIPSWNIRIGDPVAS